MIFVLPGQRVTSLPLVGLFWEKAGSEIQADCELSLTWTVEDAENLAEISGVNGGASSVAPLNVVVVAVEEIIKVGPEGEPVAAFGAEGCIL